jgi:hypothetical protein
VLSLWKGGADTVQQQQYQRKARSQTKNRPRHCFHSCFFGVATQIEIQTQHIFSMQTEQCSLRFRRETAQAELLLLQQERAFLPSDMIAPKSQKRLSSF